MLVHWVATPLIASQVMTSTLFAFVMCFIVTFSFWCLMYIGLEIDQPFGEDANDLPLPDMRARRGSARPSKLQNAAGSGEKTRCRTPGTAPSGRSSGSLKAK